MNITYDEGVDNDNYDYNADWTCPISIFLYFIENLAYRENVSEYAFFAP